MMDVARHHYLIILQVVMENLLLTTGDMALTYVHVHTHARTYTHTRFMESSARMLQHLPWTAKIFKIFMIRGRRELIKCIFVMKCHVSQVYQEVPEGLICVCEWVIVVPTPKTALQRCEGSPPQPPRARSWPDDRPRRINNAHSVKDELHTSRNVWHQQPEYVSRTCACKWGRGLPSYQISLWGL